MKRLILFVTLIANLAGCDHRSTAQQCAVYPVNLTTTGFEIPFGWKVIDTEVFATSHGSTMLAVTICN